MQTLTRPPVALHDPAVAAAPPAEPPGPVGVLITAALVVLPFLALVAGIGWLAGGNGISPLNVALGVTLYLVTGHGVTVGYHRLFTHKSFQAPTWLRVTLAVCGGMALEGGVISWVANHRAHHQMADQPGDPHSPHRYGTSPWALVKGFGWAHVGWLFRASPARVDRYARDLSRDRAVAAVDRAFPALAVVSLAVPFAIGWAATGSLSSAAWALLWAGAVRVTLLHHVTWSVNSVCHLVGERPNRTKDRSTNVWPLALLSMGESWHNHHHAYPASARHGIGWGQIDTSARLIAVFERLGWATRVRWPSRDALPLPEAA